MEYAIQDVSKFAGITSRAPRHYDAIGLLAPSRTDRSGRRFYDENALLRLQRILLLRELGVGIPAIAEVLDRGVDDVQALEHHLEQLRVQAQRVQTQIDTVSATITALREGGPLMADNMFDGFDHARYEDEARERWGDDAWQSGNAWWKRLSDAEKQEFADRHARIQDDYDTAITEGDTPESERVQEIASRHIEWIAVGWQGRRPSREAIRNLADMYVADPRFAANYTRMHPQGAEFVRDALYLRAEREDGQAEG